MRRIPTVLDHPQLVIGIGAKISESNEDFDRTGFAAADHVRLTWVSWGRQKGQTTVTRPAGEEKSVRKPGHPSTIKG